jgi:group II intron reverse transcriptase/maturase
VLQRAVARLLGAIYEADFLDCSYGFRPGRKQHQALRALRSQFIAGKVMHVHEADIRGYFNRINHQWLRRMLELRIGDPVILRLITRWLRAGVMDGGLLKRTPVGSPQGGPISPILANVYLHYALDLWFDRVFKRACKGEAYLTRWADDFVGCFQYASDARAFGKALELRLAKFGLELAPEKTRTLVFGRFARERLAETGQKPETFEFLGFRHVCGVDRKGRFAVIRLPSQRSCRSFLNRTKYWLQKHMHASVWEQQRGLSQKLRGFYQYFALPHCRGKLSWILSEVRRQWRRTLRHRGQRRNRMHWSYLATRTWFQLPTPRSLHPTV